MLERSSSQLQTTHEGEEGAPHQLMPSHINPEDLLHRSMKNLESKLPKYEAATTTGSCVLESFDDFQRAAKHEAKALVTQSVTNKKVVGASSNP